jgi:hypothetical protein
VRVVGRENSEELKEYVIVFNLRFWGMQDRENLILNITAFL